MIHPRIPQQHQMQRQHQERVLMHLQKRKTLKQQLQYGDLPRISHRIMVNGFREDVKHLIRNIQTGIFHLNTVHAARQMQERP